MIENLRDMKSCFSEKIKLANLSLDLLRKKERGLKENQNDKRNHSDDTTETRSIMRQ